MCVDTSEAKHANLPLIPVLCLSYSEQASFPSSVCGFKMTLPVVTDEIFISRRTRTEQLNKYDMHWILKCCVAGPEVTPGAKNLGTISLINVCWRLREWQGR